ncbi:MAG: uracil-DNA glycosylase family protein [Deltaproteobacteria bacterium]|nr:uracil-DNA glycosylase family protein [Deltaproteobacteria bacterium]
MSSFTKLLAQVKACTLCQANLPLGARPILQIHPQAKILIAGQAPGKKVHESGIPFKDVSGQRLRAWLGISEEVFYDPQQIAILPMAFCYPGSGQSGDLPPRPECAPAWREAILKQLKHVQLTLVLGKYAQAYHFQKKQASLTQLVQAWRDDWPKKVPLPHPSPRNQLWIRKNPWFEKELLPALKKQVLQVLA